MSDPSRLFDDAATGVFERTLLRSATLDREPEDGASRALAALGIASAAAGVGGAATSATAPTAKVIGASITTKITATIVATGAIVSTVAALAATDARETKPPAGANAATTSVSHAPHVATEPAEPAPEIHSVSVADLPPAPASVGSATVAPSMIGRAPHRATSANEPASRARPSIADEIAEIDAARAAIANGDVARGGRALDAYDARFKNGTLALEAKLARIELHLARSEQAQARALCERFLIEHPHTAYEKRVLALRERARSPRTIPQ